MLFITTVPIFKLFCLCASRFKICIDRIYKHPLLSRCKNLHNVENRIKNWPTFYIFEYACEDFKLCKNVGALVCNVQDSFR